MKLEGKPSAMTFGLTPALTSSQGAFMRVLAIITITVLNGHAAQAHSGYPAAASQAVKELYGNQGNIGAGFSCNTCHSAVPARNPGFGADFETAAHARYGNYDTVNGLSEPLLRQILVDIENKDSDGDGDTNKVEYQNGKNPGDPLSNTKGGAAPTPTPDPAPGGGLDSGTPNGLSTGGANNSVAKGDANALSGGCSGKEVALWIEKRQEQNLDASISDYSAAHKAGFSFGGLSSLFMIFPVGLALISRKRK